MPRTIQADGRTITVPDDATPDEINQIVGPAPKSAAPAQPSTFDKVRGKIDQLSTVTPEEDARHSLLTNQANHFGAGVIGSTAGVLNHPVNTVENMAHSATPDKGLAGAGEMLLGPAGPMAVHTIESLIHDPAQTLGGVAGGTLLGDAGGEVLSRGAGALSEPLQAGGAGLVDRAAVTLKTDFAHGAQPGRGYLEGGGTPALTMRGLAEKAETVKGNAGQRLGEAYDAASQPTPPQPVRGLLQAPQYDVPLADSPSVTGRASKPVVLQSNRAMPREFPHYGVNAPVGSPDLGEIPGEAGEILPPENSGYPDRANGMGPHEYIGQRSGTQGGAGQPQGVLRTRNPDISGQTPEPSGTPFPAGATRIGAGDVRGALLDPVNRLRSIQSGPGGVGPSSLLDDYEGGIRDATTGDFTPRTLFDLKRNVAANTRWNDPTMFDMNSVRQQGVGGVGKLLTDAVPETAPLNRVYQGSGNLADRATLRADTGTPPFASIVNRGLEGAAGAGLGYMTHNPFLAAAPLLMDSVPVKTSAGYMLFHAGKAAGAVPNPGLIGAGATSPLLLPQGSQ